MAYNTDEYLSGTTDDYMSGVLESVHQLKSAPSQTDHNSTGLAFLNGIEKVNVPLSLIYCRIQ